MALEGFARGREVLGRGISMRLLARPLAGIALVVGLLGAAPVEAREVVAFRDSSVSAGTIVVRTSERRLYYVMGEALGAFGPVVAEDVVAVAVCDGGHCGGLGDCLVWGHGGAPSLGAGARLAGAVVDAASH